MIKTYLFFVKVRAVLKKINRNTIENNRNCRKNVEKT